MPSRYTSTGRALLLGAPDPLALWLALLRANATYAWEGSQATLSAWPDLVSGVNAAPAGSGTVLGTLNGRVCPVFNGSGYYRTAAFTSAITQPASMVIVQHRTSGFNGTTSMNVVGGVGDWPWTIYHYYEFAGVSGAGGMRAGAAFSVGVAIGTDACVLRCEINGASSALFKDGAQLGLTGNIGAGSMAGLTIGASHTGSNPFYGSVALVALVGGANYVARAATIAAAARVFYGV